MQPSKKPAAKKPSQQTGEFQATLMLLEPDIIARMALAEYLRDCGYRVIEGYKPEEVFTVLEAGTAIDIILAHVRLSGDLDGVALAKRLRESHPGIDVILAVGTASAADKAAQLCDAGPLQRPSHPQELLRRIQLLREKRRARDDSAS